MAASGVKPGRGQANGVTVQPARAQTTADTGCTLGFLNGLLQFDPDCPLLTPPALGAEVAPPSHLVSLA